MTSETQVIEFGLGDERYCIDIDVVSEIVGTDDGELAALPGAAGHIEGVMDLRGETTTIVNPLSLLDVDDGSNGLDRILVFDSDQTGGETHGWLVEHVYRVTTVDDGAIEDTRSQEGIVRGIVNRDDGFMIWATPSEVSV